MGKYVIGHNGKKDCVYGLDDHKGSVRVGMFPMSKKAAKKFLHELHVDRVDGETRRIYKLVKVK